MATATEVYNYLIAYINKSGGGFSSWYTGIASDPETRLFTDHKVSKQLGAWAYLDAGSEAVARQVEKFIIDTHKTQGDTGGGDASTTTVYVYFVTATTKE